MALSRRNRMAASVVAAGGGVGLSALGWRRAFAQDQKILHVLAHRSHQAAMEEGPSGSVPSAWSAENNVRLEYLTFDTGPLSERLFREASLGETDIDIAFFLDSWANPNALRLMEPLDKHMASAPIARSEEHTSELQSL